MMAMALGSGSGSDSGSGSTKRAPSCAVNGTVGGELCGIWVLGEYLSVAGHIIINKWSCRAGIALRRCGMLEGEMLGQAHADWVVPLVPVI